MIKEDNLKVINKIKELPTLPIVIMRLLNTIQQPNSSAEDFAQIIMRDPSMAVNLLKLANSAFYGHSRKISTITEAIVIIGMDTLKALILGTSIFRINPKTQKGKTQLKEIWLHSLKTAVAAKIIANEVKAEDQEIIYVSALLHDLGKLIYAKFYEEDFVDIEEKMHETGYTFFQVEKTLYPFTHCELGMHVAEHWKLLGEMKAVIAMHHSPEEEIPKEYSEIINIIKIANQVGKIQFETNLNLNTLPPIETNLFDRLSLKEDDYIIFCKKVYDEKKRINSFFGLIEEFA